MIIEKINDNQIRCTLYRQDLESHQFRLNELAYGSEKAKQLFRDIMQQAQIQCGFEADNIPLMIEAIPLNAESILLIITKVEDPEELDTRFSKFAPFRRSSLQDMLQFDGADNILDILQKISQARQAVSGKNEIPSEASQAEPENIENVKLVRMYIFSSLDDVISAAHSLKGFFSQPNTLYKDPSSGDFCLVLHQGSCSPEDFNKVCNILSEYGSGKPCSSAAEAFFQEHGRMIASNALTTLMTI